MFGVEIYFNFFNTYTLTSLTCFIIEYFYPNIREKVISKNELLKNYKIMIPTVFFNLITIYPFFNFFMYYHRLLKYNNNYFIINFILWLFTTDILFYSIHRLFHTRKLYFLHSKHHNFKYTHGIGAIYASFPDFFFANIIPISVPLYLFSIPYDHCKYIVIFSSFTTVFISHSGFRFLKDHLIHHIKSKVNYGIFFTDKVLNTKYYLKI